MNNSERLKNINETIDIIIFKIDSIKRALKINKLTEKDRSKYRLNLNKALDDLAKARVLKTKLERE
ncbi:MAG: hypothetical protein M0Q13_14295 [Methanothrix sp.]|jgi:hypothetical protein|nr:hypothetical protein [Methanothrix sp.]